VKPAFGFVASSQKTVLLGGRGRGLVLRYRFEAYEFRRVRVMLFVSSEA
jgi:hypothetical protein